MIIILTRTGNNHPIESIMQKKVQDPKSIIPETICSIWAPEINPNSFCLLSSLDYYEKC